MRRRLQLVHPRRDFRCVRLGRIALLPPGGSIAYFFLLFSKCTVRIRSQLPLNDVQVAGLLLLSRLRALKVGLNGSNQAHRLSDLRTTENLSVCCPLCARHRNILKIFGKGGVTDTQNFPDLG